MNTHQNARLTEAIRRLLQDWEPVTLVAAALHVSPGTPYKWRRRFLSEGPAGLLDRSSRPHRSPRRTADQVIRRMIRLRTTRRLTGPEIAAQLQLPVATVRRLLYHAGLGRLEPPGSDRLRPRYQREQPGELLHVDLKALPRFLAVGHRIHGNPSTNGKAERFIQTCLRGWAYERPYRTSTARTAAFPTFLDFYNTARDHSALGQAPPLLHFFSRTPGTTS